MADIWDAQQAIDAILVADGDYAIYDSAPPGTDYPYFTYGASTLAADAELSGEGEDDTLYIHGWSSFLGKEECYLMRRWLLGLLNHQEIAGLWAIHEEFAEVLDETTEEGPLYHLVTRWRLRTN